MKAVSELIVEILIPRDVGGQKRTHKTVWALPPETSLIQRSQSIYFEWYELIYQVFPYYMADGICSSRLLRAFSRGSMGSARRTTASQLVARLGCHRTTIRGDIHAITEYYISRPSLPIPSQKAHRSDTENGQKMPTRGDGGNVRFRAESSCAWNRGVESRRLKIRKYFAEYFQISSYSCQFFQE